MKQSLTITDLTRMSGNHVCIAGYTVTHQCVRPVARHGSLEEVWLYQHDKIAIRPFATIEFDLGQATQHPPHCEDRFILPYAPYRVLGTIDAVQQRSFLDAIDDGAVANIFGAVIHHDNGFYIQEGEGNRSLGTIKAANVTAFTYMFYENRWLYRLTFEDLVGMSYRLTINDLALRYFCDQQRLAHHTEARLIANSLERTLQTSEVYLRIGLARKWMKFPDRCHLQITGVYTFPDYLAGKCFADLVPPPEPQSEYINFEFPF